MLKMRSRRPFVNALLKTTPNPAQTAMHGRFTTAYTAANTAMLVNERTPDAYVVIAPVAMIQALGLTYWKAAASINVIGRRTAVPASSKDPDEASSHARYNK